jgi:hypothetical protein
VARRPSGFGTFAAYKPPGKAKQPKPQTPRNFGYEGSLCEAIAKRVMVELRYDDDSAFRLIAPYVVFETEEGGVCLSCYQVANPEKPADGHEPRNFTVGKIAALRLTGTGFTVDARFNRHDPKYRHRVLCSV